MGARALLTLALAAAATLAYAQTPCPTKAQGATPETGDDLPRACDGQGPASVRPPSQGQLPGKILAPDTFLR